MRTKNNNYTTYIYLNQADLIHKAFRDQTLNSQLSTQLVERQF